MVRLVKNLTIMSVWSVLITLSFITSADAANSMPELAGGPKDKPAMMSPGAKAKTKATPGEMAKRTRKLAPKHRNATKAKRAKMRRAKMNHPRKTHKQRRHALKAAPLLSAPPPPPDFESPAYAPTQRHAMPRRHHQRRAHYRPEKPRRTRRVMRSKHRYQRRAHYRPAQPRRTIPTRRATHSCHKAHARYRTVILREYVPSQRRVTIYRTDEYSGPVTVIDYTPGYIHQVRHRVLVSPRHATHRHKACAHRKHHAGCQNHY